MILFRRVRFPFEPQVSPDSREVYLRQSGLMFSALH